MKSSTACALLGILSLGALAAARQKTVELVLMNGGPDAEEQFYYTANITVGTPGQLQTLIVDTGSTDTIIGSSNAPFCFAHRRNCSTTFDHTKSSTMTNISLGGLGARYMGGQHLNGDFITDVVQINDLSITNVQLGLAHDIGMPNGYFPGLMGLSYSSRESIRKNSTGATHGLITPRYPAFVEALVKANAISSRLFSIFPNTLYQYGSLLFGGVDTEKYNGPLTTLNLLGSADKMIVEDFHVILQQLTMEPSDGSNQTLLHSSEERRIRTFLDTGAPYWVLPRKAFDKIVADLGGTKVKPCEDVARGITNTTHFQLTLAGNGTNTATLNFELADLFVPLWNKKYGSAKTDSHGRALCELCADADDTDFSIIGGPILRAGYWVFDLDNGQVSVGRANLGSKSSNIVQVEAGVDGLRRAAKNVRSEVQKLRVEGQLPSSGTYKLSTASSTVGYATGLESYPTVTGAPN